MKDYVKVGEKIRKMASFCDIHQCGSVSKYNEVNLYCQLCEPYIINYKFYVSYNNGKWNINYSLNNLIDRRSDMETFGNIKTDKEMYVKVQEIINKIREKCGTNN